MTDQHEFDEAEAQRLAAIYTTSSAAQRRQLVRDRLDLRPGEEVLSIGCGPGFEPAELGVPVGESGRVLGIDVSEPMLAMADERCSDLPRVAIEHGDATAVPAPDESFDAAVAVQVYDYIPAVESAASELTRVLRPGGRAAVFVGDWDSMVWHSSDPDRMGRAIDVWTDLYPDPHLGSRLSGPLRDVGLDVDRIEPNSILNTQLGGTFAGNVIDLFRGQMESSDRFESAEIDAWEQDLEEIDRNGETFFNLTQYLYVVRKPE